MQRTAEVAQELYLDLGLISYPRTESKVLGGGMLDQVKVLFVTLAEDKLIQFDPDRLCLPEKEEEMTRIFNEKKIVEDHHAIIPSGIKPRIESLTPDQKKLYTLIVKRFIAAFYPDYAYQSVRVVIQAGEDLFEARKSILIDGGWKEYLKGEVKKTGTTAALEKLQAGQTLDLTTLYRQYGRTTPPPLYNDASLLQAMTSIHTYISAPDDADENEKIRIETIRKTLRESCGLGTSSSRPGIIGC